MKKIFPVLSRGAIAKAKKLGPNKVEITTIPVHGINEKPYQCENRIGQFESAAKLFTERFATIEHPSCFHKGDDCCRYIISWEKTPSLIWKRVYNYFILLSIFVAPVLFFLLPIMPWAIFVLLCAFLTLIFSLYSAYLEKKELTKIIETQGDAAKNHLEEVNIRYNNALLVQEIGQSTSTLLEIQKVAQTRSLRS